MNNIKNIFSEVVLVSDKETCQIIFSLIEFLSLGMVQNNDGITMYFEPSKYTMAKEKLDLLSADFTFFIKVKTISNENWEESWKEGYEPIQINDDLIIIPDWCEKKVIF